jgi:uncharacterized membrane protein YkoI
MKLVPVVALLSLSTLPAFAQSLDIPKTKVSMEQCLQAVLAKHPGKVKSVEMEIERGVPYYEFEVTTLLDGHTWEAECNADTGAIGKVERDVKADDPAFTKVARVGAAEAMKIALAKVPGQPKEIEYEVSPDGRAWYEFTIIGKNGASTEVMVDAATGAVIGTEDEADEQEIYRIGGDD